MPEKHSPIKYVGSITEHSSVYSDGITVKKVRNPDDTVGEYFRENIDRSGGSMFYYMRNEQDIPILQSIIAKAKTQGSITILDAGCGSAHTLYEIRDQILLRTDLAPDDVRTVGVSDMDFSDESENVAVRECIKNGDLKYVVDDLETVNVQHNIFNFIISYETLIHNDPAKVVRIIKHLLPALKEDGVFVFDITDEQKDDANLRIYLDRILMQSGYGIFEYDKENWNKTKKRTFAWIRPDLEGRGPFVGQPRG